jgi:hypothetical protein
MNNVTESQSSPTSTRRELPASQPDGILGSSFCNGAPLHGADDAKRAREGAALNIPSSVTAARMIRTRLDGGRHRRGAHTGGKGVAQEQALLPRRPPRNASSGSRTFSLNAACAQPSAAYHLFPRSDGVCARDAGSASQTRESLR